MTPRLLLALTLLLVACTDAAPEAAERTLTYTCQAGEERFRFAVEPASDRVTVRFPERYGGAAHVLDRVPDADGAKYRSEEVLFWDKGEEARLEFGGVVFTGCRPAANPSPSEER